MYFNNSAFKMSINKSQLVVEIFSINLRNSCFYMANFLISLNKSIGWKGFKPSRAKSDVETFTTSMSF